MGSDLIAWVVAITLAAAVVGLGWRRNLGETTRNWLPRYGEASEQATATLGSPDGGQRRRPLSPRQWRWTVWGYLLIALTDAAMAVLWANDRLFHATIAALFALAAVAVWKKKWPPSVDGSVS